MTKKTIRILLVEDSFTDASIILRIFARSNSEEWQITHVDRLSEAMAICSRESNFTDEDVSSPKKRTFDIILLDLYLPDSTGIDTLRTFRYVEPNIPVVVLTGLDDEDSGLQAMAEGAQDYLVKDAVTIQRLLRSIRYAFERGQILVQLKESEERTRAALRKEQELNELKSSFVAMVSHEFRTPMSTIVTSLDLLRYHEENITEDKKIQYFQRIDKAINQMLKMLDEILFLSRNEIGKGEFHPNLVNLERFCQEIRELIQFSIGKEHIISLNIIGDCSQVNIDEELVNCMITNLLSNAVKYSPTQSTVNFDVSCQQHLAIFQIIDRGIGIPEQDKIHLFESFYRATNSRKIQGTGLGLAIVKRCVEIHRGEIKVDSKEGIGTTVTVKLPLT
ncbi:response regulator receiver sensor signal transduction histidine kinase [Calothrix sp. NIES-4101]|nr:response regulator receiver sensor signal transduction histidine kinase [Calothrix sp. NIES-4101]